MSSEPLLPSREKDWELVSKCSFDFPEKERDSLSPEACVEPQDQVIVVDEGGWRSTWIVRWGRQKVLDPFIVIIRRGLEPKLLSLSAALGLTFGVFPICGIALVLCAIIAVVLGPNCHVPTLMLGNFVISPFELGLVVPFMRVGELVTGGPHFYISSRGLWEAIRGRGSGAVMLGILHAIIGWAVCAPVVIVILYATFLPVFRYLIARFGRKSLLQHRLQPNTHVLIKQDDSVVSQHDSV